LVGPTNLQSHDQAGFAPALLTMRPELMVASAGGMQ
jgi:hypothetical protein